MALFDNKKAITLNEIESGMLVEFNYTKKSGDGGVYQVLVIDPRRKKENSTVEQLHAYLIDGMSDQELVTFLDVFDSQINENVVVGLNTEEAYATFKASAYGKEQKYRIFNRSGIFQIQQILLGSIKN